VAAIGHQQAAGTRVQDPLLREVRVGIGRGKGMGGGSREGEAFVVHPAASYGMHGKAQTLLMMIS
jgi:hypothetical protein